eukprot:jgi/Mesen1/7626/ME000004S07897
MVPNPAEVAASALGKVAQVAATGISAVRDVTSQGFHILASPIRITEESGGKSVALGSVVLSAGLAWVLGLLVADRNRKNILSPVLRQKAFKEVAPTAACIAVLEYVVIAGAIAAAKGNTRELASSAPESRHDVQGNLEVIEMEALVTAEGSERVVSEKEDPASRPRVKLSADEGDDVLADGIEGFNLDEREEEGEEEEEEEGDSEGERYENGSEDEGEEDTESRGGGEEQEDGEQTMRLRVREEGEVGENGTEEEEEVDEDNNLEEHADVDEGEDQQGIEEPTGKVILYTTSVRAVRKTFDDCSRARQLLQTYGVFIDERDISMHTKFRDEMRSLIGGPAPLPQMFINDRRIGGITDIERLDDDEELKSVLAHVVRKQPGQECERCGQARFVICFECFGSKKITDFKSKQQVECTECNELGLQPCPACNSD